MPPDPSPSGDREAKLCLAVGQLRGGARHGPVSHHRSKRGHFQGCAPEIPENSPSGLSRKHTHGTNQAHAATAPQRPEGPISAKPGASAPGHGTPKTHTRPEGPVSAEPVRKHLERRAKPRNHTRFEIGPSGLKTNLGGAPDPRLRPGLPENGPSGLNRKQTHGTNQTHHLKTPRFPTGKLPLLPPPAPPRSRLFSAPSRQPLSTAHCHSTSGPEPPESTIH